MRRSRALTKIGSSFLAALLLATHSLFAHSGESNFWKDRKLALSRQAEVVEPPNHQVPMALTESIPAILDAKTIIHIEDVHVDFEAQSDIARLVSTLLRTRKIDLIALEGASGNIDLRVFQKFQNQNAVKRVSRYLLREGRISGPVASLFSEASAPAIVGIEDQSHYNANVLAYKTALTSRAKNVATTEKMIKSIALQKETVYNSQLNEFDHAVEKYRQGIHSFDQYLNLLNRYEQKTSLISTYCSLMKQQRELDLAKAERERNAVLQKLTSKLSDRSAAEFLAYSKALGAKDLEQATFYRYLKATCDLHGIDLKQYKALTLLLETSEQTSKLDVRALLQECSATEKKIYQQLSQKDSERKLITESNLLYLTKKLLSFGLSSEEWKEYRSEKAQASTTSFLDLKSFEQFYIEAETRDQRMAENLMREMESHHAKTALLITGGFHSYGIKDQTASNGYKTFFLSPHLSNPNTGGTLEGLSALLRDKMPLEYLYSGINSLLPPNPASRTVIKAAAPLTVGAQLLEEKKLLSIEEIARLVESVDVPADNVKVTADTADRVNLLVTTDNGQDAVEITNGTNDQINVVQHPAIAKTPTEPGLSLRSLGRIAMAAKITVLAIFFFSVNGLLKPDVIGSANVPYISIYKFMMAGLFAFALYSFVLAGHAKITLSNFRTRLVAAAAGLLLLSAMPATQPVLAAQPILPTTVMWNPNLEPDILNYNIYLQYQDGSVVSNNVGMSTFFHFQRTPDQRIKLWATAVNTNNVQSEPSLNVVVGPPVLLTLTAQDITKRVAGPFTFSDVNLTYLIAAEAQANRRWGVQFSDDGGKNWFNVERKFLKTSEPYKLPESNNETRITITVTFFGNIPQAPMFRLVGPGMMEWVRDGVLKDIENWAKSRSIALVSTVQHIRRYYLAYSSGIEYALSLFASTVLAGVTVIFFPSAFNLTFINTVAWVFFAIPGHTKIMANQFKTAAPKENFRSAIFLALLNIGFTHSGIPAKHLLWIGVGTHLVFNLLSQVTFDTRTLDSLVKMATRSSSPQNIRIFVGDSETEAVRIFDNVVPRYVKSTNENISIALVADSDEALSAIQNRIQQRNSTHVHVVKRSLSDRVVDIEAKIKAFYPSNVFEQMQEGEFQLLRQRTTVTPENFMEGIPLSAQGRYRQFVMSISSLFGPLVVELGNNGLAGFIQRGLQALRYA